MLTDDSVYVVFTKGNPHWWTWFLDKETAHCYIIKPDCDRWLVYGKSHKCIDLHTISTINDILADSDIVKAIPKQSRSGLFMLNTCVGNMKQLLGIRKPFLWTPLQLKTYLEESHGK